MIHRAKLPHFDPPGPIDEDFQTDDEMEQIMTDEKIETTPIQVHEDDATQALTRGQVDQAMVDSPDVRAIEEFLVQTGRLVRREDLQAQVQQTGSAAYAAGVADGQAQPVEADPTDELSRWWLQTARAEVGPLAAKATEYGGEGRAVDLIDIGRRMAALGGHTIDDANAAELGVYFYITGKMGRWHAAIENGRAVSDDTLHDIGVYVRMAQRIRAVGGWPV